jgi:endonuclease G, mitochondrial
MLGYDESFVPGSVIPLPTLSDRLRHEAYAAGEPIHHTRFSVVFHAERGFAILTAHNFDGAALLAPGQISRRNRFRRDPSVPSALQVDDNRGYRLNRWDRGHLVRRDALHWGDPTEAGAADSESFYWTNIAPQHEHLHDTAWGSIEDWMMQRAATDEQRAAVFTGPILTPDDPEHVNLAGQAPIRIPAGYWKVMALPHGGRLVAAAFLVWQRDHDRPEPVDFDPVLEQVRITTIEHLTGLAFESLRACDPLHAAAADRALGRPPPRGGVVTDPGDIVL